MAIKSKARIKEILETVLTHGEPKACELLNVTPETIARYKRKYKEMGEDAKIPEIMKKLQDRYSEKELQALATGSRISRNTLRIPNVKFDGDLVTIGLLGDTHIGSVFFNETILRKAFDEFSLEGVDYIMHVGDVSEGMSGRTGHVYELSEIGFQAQRKRCIELFKEWHGQIYMIDGNHDRWFAKTNQAMIVEDICDAIPNCGFLGHDTGDMYINGAKITLWHGEDSSSYATSYRIQKLAEAFTGGDKPNVLFCGHTHKMGYFMERNIHIISAGAIQTQSDWMRSKRLPCHVGFWIIRMWLDGKGITKFSPTWYPFYA